MTISLIPHALLQRELAHAHHELESFSVPVIWACPVAALTSDALPERESMEKHSELIKDFKNMVGYKITIQKLVVFPHTKYWKYNGKKSIYSQYTEKYKTCRNKSQMSRTVLVMVSAGNRWYIHISIIGGRFNKGTIYKEGAGCRETSRDSVAATARYYPPK